ncbi:efflux RND transporter permease subunit [Ruminococcus sp.]|uniref:efflux RND transporter permease subunit n=1 Tax=Ruminococcus sp. TaxID=41978 RepID=UPI002631EF5E|nr:efflux RND transporter permease subunit [Ruminococcus sp.]MDD6988705.1 efflux RND transporter permease subunit [Ruminococcus sp.]MDY6201615.1 efflux RND transporter permease subunit [Ruminococcus sp.]
MLSKFSVKKPMTVFVCVVIIIVLGIVSFTKMTPDLLPNMDFPYAMIMTTYGGQTPETVESTVTKPLEQSISTIDGVKEITSNSAENYSVLIIEFEDGTNMDTATVDLRSSLDTISDSWPDGVGTPYLIKANPSMLPVAMTAVEYEGKDRNELSDYVSNELINKLEGIDGVASVSDKGIVVEEENIVISQKKIDALNKKISAALDDQFADAEDKLDSAKKEIDDNISQAESGSQTISSSIEQINAQQEAVASQLEDAQKNAESGKTQLLSAKMQLLDQKSSLTQTKQTLETAYQALLSIKSSYEELLAQKQELTDTLNTLNQISDNYVAIVKQMATLDKDSEEYKQLEKHLEQIDEQLKPYNIRKEGLALAIESTNAALSKVDTSLEQINDTLAELGTDTSNLDSTLKELTDKIAVINDGIAQIDSAIVGLDDKSVSVDSALATISKQQSSADFKMSSALSTLTAKQSEVQSAATQLDSAKTEVQSSIDTLKEQKDKAKDKADMNNTVTLENVSNILTAQNFSMPAGYITDDENNKYMVRVGDKVDNEDELKNLVLFDTKIDGIGVVTLDDVADVFLADNSDEIYAKINGNAGVVLSFSKQSDIATSTVCENINTTLKELSEENDGLNFTNLYSQGDYISIVINSVLQNLLLGAILAIIILFLFLRDIKPTIIVACSIPISVVFAIVLMYFSGVTLNMISLSGLAIGVGMLVDNSVVVIENIYRLRGLGYSPIQASLNGAKQVAGAIASSTLTTICVFLPIVFVEGITRQLFVDMALTIAYSLLASLIVALTVVPAMGQRMLRKIKPQKNPENSKIIKGYEKSLRFVLRHKVCAIVVVVAILCASMFGALAKGFSFMPNMSSTEIQVSAKLDDNATLEETIDTAEQINKILNGYDEFETVGVMTGSSTSLMGLSGGSSSDAGSVTAYGVLKDEYTKQSEEICDRLNSDLEKVKGEITVSGGSSTSSMSSLLGDGGIEITLYGDDIETLKKTAEDMAKQLETVEGIDETDSGVGATSPEIKVSVNKEKAAEKGLTVAQVYQQVASAVSSEKTSTTLTNGNGNNIDVVIVKDESKKASPDTIGNIDITYKDSEENEKTTSLSSIADISKSETIDVITRQDQKRYLSITGTLKNGYTLTDVSNNAQKLFNDYKLPEGCSIEFAGSNKATMEAISQLMLMLLLGVVLIYLIMVAQFQSLKSPFIIMFTIPLAFTGGFLGLLITGFDVSVVSLIGFIMLCGIIVNNGIVLVDYINRPRRDGKERVEAIVEAGKTRMRPILITALTTILGLSVMALGIGTGAEMMQPLAIVCIGGLIYATFMTLYIIPVIYDAFNKKELRKVEESELETIDE